MVEIQTGQEQRENAAVLDGKGVFVAVGRKAQVGDSITLLPVWFWQVVAGPWRSKSDPGLGAQIVKFCVAMGS